MNAVVMTTPAEVQFRSAIEAAGLTPPDSIEADGELHRFASNGRRGDLAGWYVFHADGVPAGAFGCWRSGLAENWHADVGRTLTHAEREQQHERIDAAKRKRERAEHQQHVEAARRAAIEWDSASPAADDHPYLVLKGVRAHGLRQDAEGRLLVPVRDRAGAWQSLQYIPPDGKGKRFLWGGKAAGGYFAIGKPDGTLCIAEGFATAATIHEATGHPVVVAFSAGNLDPVARVLREKLPGVRLILCADDDAWTDGNPGLTKATGAAHSVGGVLAVPDFGADRPKGATDFNDLAQHRGAEAVRECIARAAHPGWREPQPLPSELHPVRPFDLDLLPDSLRPWIADVCDRVQCPPDFVAVPVIAALGSLIGRKVRIRPKALDSWTVVPNVWGCIIGRPGTMKSPAVSEALQPLRRLEAQARDEFEVALADYETQAELAKLRKDAARDKARAALKKSGGEVSADALRVDVPDEPILRRYTAHQSSVQALGELLRQNPNGLLVERDELAALLSDLAQEEQAEARGFYLTGADGVAGYTFDTIGRGLNRRVDAVCLSIIGTTQPGKIGRYLRQARAGGEGDDGLMQRFGLMVWPDAQQEWRNVDRFPDGEARRAAFEVFDRLDRLTPDQAGAEDDDGIRYLRFEPDALAAFTKWRAAWERRLRSDEWHPVLESHFAKYRKTIPALALILHLADGGKGPVTLQATVRALAWSEYLESHALRCYGATVAGEVAAAKRILARIRKGDLADGFRAREIDRAQWSELTDRETVRAALGLLVTLGYLVEVELPATATGGRPTLAYRVHPSLRHDMA